MADELRKGPSGPPADEIDVDTIDAAIVAGFEPSTAGSPGYVSRHVYANAASASIGQSYAGVPIEASVTFATAAQLPPGNRFTVDVFGNGAGGSSGRALDGGTTNVQGGTGGGGAAHNRADFARADILARLPITMTIPLGSAGGVAVVGTTPAPHPASNVGIGGGICSFGTLLVSFGGGGGGSATGSPTGNVPVGGAGGGIQSVGDGSATTLTVVRGGRPRGSSITIEGTPNSGLGGADGPSGASAAGAAGLESAWGGASGGNGRVNEGVGAVGGDCSMGCAAGAAAATRNSLTATPLNGVGGGLSNFPANSVRAVGGTGADGTLTAVATAGAPGAIGVYPFGGNGGASGGDARSTSSGSTAQGGAGGAGGFPGGGGGGGGPAITAANSTPTSGAGGVGGDACIVLTGWY